MPIRAVLPLPHPNGALDGRDVLLIPKTQAAQIAKKREAGGRLYLTLSKAQLMAVVREKSGSFLGVFLGGVMAPILGNLLGFGTGSTGAGLVPAI
ncbi:MAG: hypothetical protein AB2556_23455 [Candidatus Thiodiazotropha sp.]